MTYQLKYNTEFNNIIPNIPYWSKKEDIPLNIVEFIEKTSNHKMIYEEKTNKFYCGKCLELVNEKFYCTKCCIQHDDYSHIQPSDNEFLEFLPGIHVVTELEQDYSNCNNEITYFVFDIKNDLVYLYLITEFVTYNNPMTTFAYKKSDIEISKVYLVQDDGISELKDNIYYSYKYLANLKNQIPKNELKENENELKWKEYFPIFEQSIDYIYVDNLIDLKDTIYKYTYIWDCAPSLKKCEYLYLGMLTYTPIYCKQFEYLVKYKLYDLALYNADQIIKGRDFKETFGVDKKYLPFMVKNNINISMLNALKLYPTNDLDKVNLIADYYYILKEIVENTNINIEQILNYLNKQKLPKEYICDYCDYLKMADESGYDLKDKKIKFPDNLIEEHDKLYLQMQVVKDPKINELIGNIADALKINYYDDNNYIIFPATSIEKLIDESRQQCNCVRTYIKRISNCESQIYFMRKKQEPNKSFVTIEVINNKIVQARVKYNKLPDNDIMNILKKWEKSLYPIKVEF